MRTHLHVMPDLHQIVDLATGTDDRIWAGAAVNGRVGTDFYIIFHAHAPKLGHLHMPTAPECEPEPVLPDLHPAVQNHAVANQAVAEANKGGNLAVLADLHAISNGDWQALQADAQAVLAAAAGIVRDGDLPDAQVEALRAALGEEVLTELLLICSIYVGLARFLHVARIEVEADYMPELQEFPLPPG